MTRFNNDYTHSAIPEIIKALSDTSGTGYAGYGTDELCAQAAEKIKAAAACPNAHVCFFPGATQANYTVIASALTSVQSVISADTGHINCHEAASVENTGHKILSLPNTDGKISAQQIENAAKHYYESGEAEYLTEPKMVYLSFPTEKGTLYTLNELKNIHAVCRKYNMHLFVDGARMGYGLSSEKNDISLSDFSKYTDVFYIGGTKCGALFGEALVITNPALSRRFKAYMKQNGAVLAKGWLMGLQFSVLFEDERYFTVTKRANQYAMQIKQAFVNQGIPLWTDSFTNQQFVILNDKQKQQLAENYCFEEEEKTKTGTVVRFCTSWATTQADIDALKKDILKL